MVTQAQQRIDAGLAMAQEDDSTEACAMNLGTRTGGFENLVMRTVDLARAEPS